MRSWDASAIVPLLVAEETSGPLEALFGDPLGVAVWWATEVECASALTRLERMGSLTASETTQSFHCLHELATAWHVIDPVESIRRSARRFLRVHDLRAVDALQLAAAFLACEGRPGSLEVVCLDHRLARAAEREGFKLLQREDL